MDSFFFACTVAAVGVLILSLIFSEKGKAGAKPVGLLAMLTGAERPVLLRGLPGGGKKARPKVGEALMRRPPAPKTPQIP